MHCAHPWPACSVLASSPPPGDAGIPNSLTNCKLVINHRSACTSALGQEPACCHSRLYAVVPWLHCHACTHLQFPHTKHTPHTRHQPQVCLHLSPGTRARLLPQLLYAVVPWLNCHAHNVRPALVLKVVVPFMPVLLYAFVSCLNCHAHHVRPACSSKLLIIPFMPVGYWFYFG